MVAEAETIEQVSALAEKYKYGFVTDIETESAPKGLKTQTAATRPPAIHQRDTRKA